MSHTLTLSEELLLIDSNHETLEDLEEIIDAALQADVANYMTIGEALTQIRDRQLLMARSHSVHSTANTIFSRHAKAKWGFCKSTVYDYINAAAVGRALLAEGKPLPKSVRACLELLPKKPRKKPQAQLEDGDRAMETHTPEDSSPVTEDGSPTPTMHQNMLDMFQGIDVTPLESMDPGRWLLDGLTTDQMRICARALAK